MSNVKLLRARWHAWLKRNTDLIGAYSSIMGLVLAPLILVGGVAGYIQLKDALETPEVTLHFDNPEDPRFSARNLSSKLARNALYELRLFNFSVVPDNGRYLNLEIPVGSLEFVRPGRGFGPWTIRSQAHQGASIQNGHHLFGHAQIQCPTCETVREYWVYVHVARTGWYAEISPDEARPAMALLDVVLGGPDYLKSIKELVPPHRRLPMPPSKD